MNNCLFKLFFSCLFQEIDNSDIKQEKEEEQSISQRGDQLDFTDQDQDQDQNQNQNPEHHTNNPIIERGESDSPSATTDTQVSVRVYTRLFLLVIFRPYRTTTGHIHIVAVRRKPPMSKNHDLYFFP